ncbi:MAG: 1-acyl-sn-glycerol-3-phosphate acyltransferase [Xenococcaceae cyanobacterium]
MPDLLTQAQPPLEFIQPSLNPLVVRAAQTILPLWLRLKTNITEIQGAQVEALADLYHQFQTGKIRFMMAFRHPSTNDPFCMAYLLWQLVAQTARQQGISLQSPVHAHFIYDRGIPLWAGSGVGWLYSRLGSTPIQRGKIDRVGLRSARHLFANGHLPMAAAPEGATNGHNEIVSFLEPGIAQLGFWCVEDLLKTERSEQVLIVPIGIQYRYVTPPWKPLEKLLAQLEVDSGLTTKVSQVAEKEGLNDSKTSVQQADEIPLTSQEVTLYQRLYSLGEHLLSLLEEFYTKFYHQSLPKVSVEDVSCADSTEAEQLNLKATMFNSNALLSARLQNLLDVALKVAEQYFDLKPKGNLIDRCRRLEQAGWDCIYRDELKSTQTLSTVERGLADRVAEEASLRMWHMRIVESFVAVTGYYVREKLTVERFAETTLLLWDLVTRIQGGNPFHRPQLGKQRVQITVGEPISVSERWTDYQVSRRQAVAKLTQDLQTALESMILTE